MSQSDYKSSIDHLCAYFVKLIFIKIIISTFFLSIKSLEFHAKAPYNTTKTDKSVVKSAQNAGPFNRHAEVVLRLQVPPIPPSQLEYCSIIDQKYTLRITLHVSGMYVYIIPTCNINNINAS